MAAAALRGHGVVPKSEAILHFSWARSEADIIGKLESWSHNTDFDWKLYLDKVWRPSPRRWMWTYNFHPVWPRCWPALRPIQVPPSLTQGPIAASVRPDPPTMAAKFRLRTSCTSCRCLTATFHPSGRLPVGQLEKVEIPALPDTIEFDASFVAPNSRPDSLSRPGRVSVRFG